MRIMEALIMSILEVALIAVSGFMIKKYVFLEPSLEPKKQRMFYWLSFAVITAMFFIFGKDVTLVPMFALIGWNIYLGRKEHKLRGLFMMIPLPGIIDGFTVPMLRVVPYLFSLSERGTHIYQCTVYGILFLLIALFYVKGKAWRARFEENTRDRQLRYWEKLLICMTGVLIQVFSLEVAAQINTDESYSHELAPFMSISSIVAVVMTVTIITLIMQGNKRAYYHNRVSAMQSGMISFMAEVVENRDDNTGGHIRRTAKYVEDIAKELKKQGAYSDILTDRYMEDMVVAAPLHDIGKIHIPDAVLNKPGKLTDEEFEVMKTHTLAGKELLAHAKDELGESGYLNMAVEMAAYHHERWDGTGYPYGISGEEIPLCARIMAVADVFDALTSKRCYKNAMPFEKAYEIIREGSGAHFDPKVAEAFFSAAEDMKKTEKPNKTI